MLRLWALLCAFVAGNAFAQASPFAGSWSGNLAGAYMDTCGRSAYTCTSSQSWSGSIDSQGVLKMTNGPGMQTCNGATTAFPAGGTASFLVSPDGVVQLGAPSYSDSTTSYTCSAWTLQFSLSPPSVSGALSCIGTSLSSGGAPCISHQSIFSGAPTGTLLAPPTPVFPMTVTSNITVAIASATARFQPRVQDAGITANVYVFAHARRSALAGGTKAIAPRDGPASDPCVLAQLDPSGQLTAVSGSSLQPYATGVLSAQGQTVTVLNNVSTPNVAGASFFVGYGPNSSSMLSNGIYQGAVTVDGTSGCSAALLAGAAPNAPGALSGLWWNAAESGWGVGFTQRRNVIFAAWYTYDGSGNPKWYVASNCAMPSGNTGTSGTCNGKLYSVSGPAFFGVPFDATAVNAKEIGTLQVAFRDANNATMTWVVNPECYPQCLAPSQTRTIAIARQVFQPSSAPPAVDYTDLWWNPNESGWGMAITHQFGAMFLAWYVYDTAGKPIWYVASNCVVVGSSCSGPLYRTTGPPLGPTFDPASVHVFDAGTVSVNFLDANNASLSYTVDGITSTKLITRQLF